MQPTRTGPCAFGELGRMYELKEVSAKRITLISKISFKPKTESLMNKSSNLDFSGKSASLDPLPPRRFERKNEWGMGVGIACISNLLHFYSIK